MHLTPHHQAAQLPRTRFSGAWFLSVLLCLSLLMPATSATALAAPVIDINSDLNLVVNTSAIIDSTLLSASEVGKSPNLLVFTIVSSVTQGRLTLSGTDLIAGSTFTQVDLIIGALSYSAPAAISTVTFTFNVSDGAGGVSPDTVYTIHVNKPEPTVYPTNFQAVADSTGQITTTWTDVPGADAPDGYLVVCGSWSPFSVLDTAYPMDMACTDGSGRMHVAPGVGSAVWQGLNSEMGYSFAIFPYARTQYTPPTGAYTDYFTGGTPPEASATTWLNYSISGMVTDSAQGFGLMSILIDAGNGQSVYTGEDGSYTLTGLTPGDYTLTARSPYYVFNPVTQPVTVSDLNNHVSGINFSGTALPVIRGSVMEGGQPLGGVLIDDASHSATSYWDGAYNIPVANGWSGDFAPHLLNYYFIPDRRRYTSVSADQVDQNYVGTKLSIRSDEFTAAWGEVLGATGYRLDVATDAAFTNFVPGYENKDVGLVVQARVQGLAYQTHYFYRVRAYDLNQTGENSTPVEVLTLPPFLYFLPIVSR